MKNWISVCKNVIVANNKKNWVDADPAIRVSSAKHGQVILRSNKIGIVDKDGNIVATMVSSTDGKPVIGCGAKVGLITEYSVIELED